VWGGVKAIGRGINGFRRKHPFWTGVIATTITGAAAYAGRVIYVKISGGDPEDVEIELPEDMPEEVAQTVTDAVQEIIQDDTLSDEEIQNAVMEAVQDAVSDLPEEVAE
jgi:ATP-dependent Zn protease